MAYTDQLQKQFLGGLSSAASGNFQGPGGMDLGLASNWFRTLLGGNRQALQQAVAPAANAARDQADAQKREQARMGTARTGGTAAANQQTEDQIRKQIDTLIGGQQASAAGELGNIGNAELSQMMNALNVGGSLAQSDINSRRAASAQMWSALIGGAADVATGGIAALGQMRGGGGNTGGTPSIGVPSGIAAPNPNITNTLPTWSPPTFGPTPGFTNYPVNPAWQGPYYGG